MHDRRPPDEKEKFTSKILPPYLRKTKSIEELIPWLQRKGLKDLEQVRGIVFLKNGRVHRTPPRPSITDLDALPWPDRDVLNRLPVRHESWDY